MTKGFRFKKFLVEQEGAAHPVGTDSVLLGAWAEVEGARTILDVGTGTGVVALMLLQRAGTQARVDAVELQELSTACARRNFERSPWPDRLKVYGQSIQEFARQHEGKGYDLIVSNPPFFAETVVSPDPGRRLGRTASGSLSPGELLSASRKLLLPSGKLCVVLPAMEGKRFAEMAVFEGLYVNHQVAVRGVANKPVERLLLALSADPRPFRREELAIYAYGEVYSEPFRALTGAYYL